MYRQSCMSGTAMYYTMRFVLIDKTFTHDQLYKYGRFA